MERAVARLVAKELLLTESRSSVLVHGRSMSPFLEDGDELLVEAVDWPDIRVGDVLTCRLDERFPTLRVVRKHATKVALRADNWPFADFEAWPEDVLGRVVARRRHAATLVEDSWSWRAARSRALVDDRLRRVKRRSVALVSRIARGLARRAVEATGELGERPASLHVNVSASCNLGCRMCPYLDVHDSSAYPSEMTAATFERLLPAVPHLRSIHLSGSGEPFFNRLVPRFIEQIRDANPAIVVNVTSNGTLLAESLCRELVRVHLDRLTVSIDGITERTVGAIRLGINLAKVLANLRTLARVKADAASRVPVLRVNYMIGFGSYDELPELVRQARSLGIEEIHVLDVITGSAESVRDNLAASVARDGGRRLREAKRLADAAGIDMLFPYTLESACTHPYTPHVSESGDVSPCCYVDYEGRTLRHDDQEIRLPHLDYGNVRDRTFTEIWTSPDYRQLRARDRRGDFPDFCRTCHEVRLATSRAVHQVMD